MTAVTLIVGSVPSIVAAKSVVPMVVSPAAARVVRLLPDLLPVVGSRHGHHIGLPDHHWPGIDRWRRKKYGLWHCNHPWLLPNRRSIADGPLADGWTSGDCFRVGHFGPGGDGHVRFALIENEQRIHQAVRNLRKTLTKLG